MDGFIRGFSFFFRGAAFSFRGEILKWYIVPLALWLFLMVYLTFSLSGLLLPYIDTWLDSIPGMQEVPVEKNWWSTLRSWISAGLSFTVALAVKVILWYILGRYMKYIIQILLSPLLAWLSERTEEMVTGRSYPFNLAQFSADVLRGILITVRNMLIETLLTALALVASLFLPILAPLFTALMLIVNSYFMGFNFYDYVAERRRLSIAEGVQFMRANRWELIGFGFAYNLVSAVPVLDWLLAPVSGAVGASLAVGDRDMRVSPA